MRKIIGFRTLCVGLGIWVGTVGVSAQGEFKALPVKVPLIILI